MAARHHSEEAFSQSWICSFRRFSTERTVVPVSLKHDMPRIFGPCLGFNDFRLEKKEQEVHGFVLAIESLGGIADEEKPAFQLYSPKHFHVYLLSVFSKVRCLTN
ncbi:unnamed protein product [Hapterophycus canaliculatus]